MGREHDTFNCSEDHEHNYVVGLYIDRAGVRKFLKENCESGIISDTSHEDLYEMLEDAGFERN